MTGTKRADKPKGSSTEQEKYIHSKNKPSRGIEGILFTVQERLYAILEITSKGDGSWRSHGVDVTG